MSNLSLPFKQILSLLGIATKAGKLVSGEYLVEKAVKEMKAYLVVIAEDASDNTKKHFSDMCAYRNIEILITSEKSMLGKHTGKQERASVGILDRGFAEKLISIKREG